MFKTCVVLHSWLLDYDGLNEGWKAGVKSDWKGPMGNYEPVSSRKEAATCNATAASSAEAIFA